MALGDPVPKLVAKEEDDGSCPVEAITKSNPVGPSL